METTNALPIGIHPDIPAGRYQADTAVSNTMLTSLAKSPAHCWAEHLDPERPERASTITMRRGSLLHTAVLEPAQLPLRYVTRPAGMTFVTKAGKAWRDSVPTGAEIVTADDMSRALQQADTVRRQPTLGPLLMSGAAEVTVVWTDEATGLRCRARPDWVHQTGPKRCIVVDLKTISDLTLHDVQSSISRYSYHRQRAHYSAGLRAHGWTVEEFVFAFVSSAHPLIAAPFILDDESAKQGEEEVAELLAQFAACRQAGDWPFCGSGYQMAGLQAWARRNQVEMNYVDD